METWKCPEPIELARSDTSRIPEVIELIQREGKRDMFGHLSAPPRLQGFIDKTLGLSEAIASIRPLSYRLEGQSSVEGLTTSKWHADGCTFVTDDSSRIAVLGYPISTQVITGSLARSARDMEWTLGIGTDIRDLVARSLDSGMAHVLNLEPGVLYLLEPGTIHRRPDELIRASAQPRLYGRSFVS